MKETREVDDVADNGAMFWGTKLKEESPFVEVMVKENASRGTFSLSGCVAVCAVVASNGAHEGKRIKEERKEDQGSVINDTGKVRRNK